MKATLSRHPQRVVFLVLVSLILHLQARAAELTWTKAGGGDWAVATNWSPSQIPGPSDTAILALNATVTVSSAAAVSNLVLSTGTLNGSGTLTVGGTMTWTGGTMTGSGGATVIQPGANLVLSGTGTKTLNLRMLDNAGTVTWTAGTWSCGGGVAIRNQVTGVIDVQGDEALTYNGYIAVAQIQNLGLVMKTGGAGVSRLEAAMNNDGTLQIDTGSVDLARGGLSHGTFIAGAGKGLSFSGGTMTLETNSAVTVAGKVSFTGGSVNVKGGFGVSDSIMTNSADVKFNGTATVTNLTFSSGYLAGTGRLVVEGAMTWTGGTMQGTGRTVIQSGAELVLGGSSDKTLSQRTLENSGTLRWAGGTLWTGMAASILNQPAAVIDVQGDLRCAHNGNGSLAALHNSGLVKKTSGTATNLLEITVNNAGTLDTQSGVVTLNKSGDHGGVFQTGLGTTLNLAGGTMTLQAGASLTGAGTVLCSGSAMTVNGLVSASVSNLVLTAGTLNGSGTLAVGGTMTWTGGTMTGSGGATVIQPGANLVLSGTGTKTLNLRMLDNAGTVTWIDGTWSSGSGATIRNQATGVIDLQGDETLMYNLNVGMPQIQNLGLLKKSGGAGISRLEGVFDNKGILQACTGQLLVAGSLPQTAASVIEIQIGGVSPDAHGQVASGTVAQLTGTLQITPTDAFHPALGDNIEILKFGSRTGVFDHISGLTLANGFFLEPTFTPTNVFLTVLTSRPGTAFDLPILLPNRNVQLSLSHVAGDSLVISATTNLTTPFWTPILTNLDCTMVLQFTDTETSNYPQRFYRVERLP